MSDRVFFSLAAVGMLAMIALSSVFPQGAGRRSPAPFGHETEFEAQARRPALRPALKPAPQKPGVL